jgi:membrane protein involved in colicin uptake
MRKTKANTATNSGGGGGGAMQGRSTTTKGGGAVAYDVNDVLAIVKKAINKVI